MSEGHDDHGHGKQSFISKYIFSYDHKMIAKQYLTLVMFMAVVGGSLAMLVRLQLGWPCWFASSSAGRGSMRSSGRRFFPPEWRRV